MKGLFSTNFLTALFALQNSVIEKNKKNKDHHLYFIKGWLFDN